MNPSKFRALTLIFMSCLTATTTAHLLGQTVDQPNIVLIMADDLGYECVSANGGSSYQTPCLDQLAKSGMRFEHCYSQPLCTPSRVKIMTGVYNIRNYTKFGVLPETETTFANLLRDAGYETCIVGKWQLKGTPQQFGFDESCLWQLNRVPERYPNPGLEINSKRVDFKNGEYGPDIVSDFACDFIRRKRDKPFLVYYPMILTHCPFGPTPDSPAWDPTSKGSQTYKGDPQYFPDMVAYMDKIVGKLATTLEETGQSQNTLVIFTGDNGTDKPIVSMMGEQQVVGGKKKMTDAGTRAAMIAHWPGTIAKGRVSQDLVDFSDFLPTFCAAAHVKIPATLKIDGVSFLPQLLGETGVPRQWVYCWFSRNGEGKGQQWARNQQWKLYGDGRLYDISTDPLEQSPIAQATLTAVQASNHSMLQAVLNGFREARPKQTPPPPKSK